VINPAKDASDSEISLKNNFSNLAKNMDVVSNGVMRQKNDEIFRPRQYGALSKNNKGARSHVMLN
jgi:hypothetical protein